MSRVFHRQLHAVPPVAVAGDGCYLIDREGRRYLDASGGAAVSCLGHSDAKVAEAVREQVSTLAFAHTAFLTSEPAEALAATLAEHAPGALNWVYFVSGGSEANEAALKLARQYFLEIGQPERHRIIARRQSYHGNTLGALATGGSVKRREPFLPLLVETAQIEPCYEYRHREPGESPEAYGQRAANALEAEVLRLGPESVMAFIAEPVVGSTLGGVPAVAGYFRRIREICDTHGVLLILDEVMCGMGRPGTLFACEQDGVEPDILCIAKGLGAGYQPIGAMLCSDTIHAAIRDGSGFFQHGHTYLGHSTACAAAGAVLRRLTEDGLVARAKRMGERLRSALDDAFGQHPHVGDIRGRGMFLGIELVRDRETREPFDPARKLHAKVKSRAFDAGLICYPGGGTVDGTRGDHILLAPPLILTDDQVGEIADKLAAALAAALKGT